MLRGYKSIVCGALALGLAACSTSVKLPWLGGPTPDQPRSWTALLSTLRTCVCSLRRLTLKSPLPSSNTDAEREAKLKLVNGKLYTVAKAEFDKSCPTVANGPTGSVVR